MKLDSFVDKKVLLRSPETFACLVMFMLLLSSADFFFKLNLFKKIFLEHYQRDKRLDPVQSVMSRVQTIC